MCFKHLMKMCLSRRTSTNKEHNKFFKHQSSTWKRVLKALLSTSTRVLAPSLLSRIVYCKTPILSTQIHLDLFLNRALQFQSKQQWSLEVIRVTFCLVSSRYTHVTSRHVTSRHILSMQKLALPYMDLHAKWFMI